MTKPFQKPVEQILKELLSFSQSRSPASWESNMIRWPLGASSNSGSSESNFLNNAKVEDEKAKAPKIKPYPLNFINDNITDIFLKLCELKKTLIQAIKYPGLSKSDTLILKKEVKNIVQVIDLFKKMYYNIEKVSL